MKNEELHKLLTRIQEGDTEAFQTLYLKMYRAVCSVCYATLRDYQWAEDAAQETFLSIYSKMRNL